MQHSELKYSGNGALACAIDKWCLVNPDFGYMSNVTGATGEK